VTYYLYRLSGTEDRVIRILAGMIPDTKKATLSMDNWLKVKNRNLVNSSPENTSNTKLRLIKNPSYEIMTRTCYEYFEEIGWAAITCEDAIVTANRFEEDTNGGGSGYDWDDMQSGQDPTYPLPSGGGGYDYKGPDPCDTNGKHPALDDPKVQEGMNNIWQKSLNTNNEQGAFVYPTSYSGYAFNPLADHLIISRSYRSIEFRIPENLPNGTIFMHTHPTRETLEKFGITNKYRHHPSDSDYDVISNPTIMKGYILDPNMIIKYDENEIIGTVTRCGY